MDERLRALNWLYNQALHQRKTAYQRRRESIGLFDQCKWLTALRAARVQGLGDFACGPQRGMLKRLDEAFQAFFRRVKAGQPAGYPRFRPLSRCVTIDVTNVGPRMVRQRGKYSTIHVAGFPRIKLYAAQRLPVGQALKSLRLTKRGRHWAAALVYQVEKAALEPEVKAVGIDLGVRKRMTLSDGQRYEGYQRNWKRIRKAQRAVSRCQRESNRRRKRVVALQRHRRKEFVSQRNACHRATTQIVRAHGLIAVERLQVKNMTGSAKGSQQEPGRNVPQKAGLNRAILSQNWSLLRSQLAYKAECAGREYVEVDPQYTSQDCSRCHARNDPGKSEVYRCKACEMVADRDVNAAINILAAGILAAGALTWAIGPSVAPEPCRAWSSV